MHTILLVEDDAGLRYSMARHLTDAGYDVIAAADAMAALSELRSQAAIDLLLTDIVMPHGLALACMARMRRSHLPIVFMTGYDDVASPDADLLGSIVHKPVDMDALLKAVGDLLEVSPARA